MYKLVILLCLAFWARAMPVEENTVEAKFETTFTNMTYFNMTVPSSNETSSAFKVGRCSLKEYAQESLKCEREFFLSFRMDHSESEPCSMKVEEIKECAVESLKDCIKGTLPKSMLESSLQEVKKGANDYYKLFCSDKLYNISDVLKSLKVNVANICAPGFTKQLYECQLPLMEAFRKNPGNASLCEYYGETMKCMNKTMSVFCEYMPEFMKANSWMFSKKFNPFCDAKQRNETVEEDHDHDHDYEDHDHDHDYEDHDHDYEDYDHDYEDHDHKDRDYDHDHDEKDYHDEDDDYQRYKKGFKKGKYSGWLMGY